MAGSPNAELADLLNEMLSVQERLRKHGIAFGTGLPGPPAGQPEATASSSYAPAGTPALGTTTHTTGLQHRADLFPTFWGEPVSAFHGRMGYSANMWLHHFESLRPEDQPPTMLSGCESFLSMTQVVSPRGLPGVCAGASLHLRCGS